MKNRICIVLFSLFALLASAPVLAQDAPLLDSGKPGAVLDAGAAAAVPSPPDKAKTAEGAKEASGERATAVTVTVGATGEVTVHPGKTITMAGEVKSGDSGGLRGLILGEAISWVFSILGLALTALITVLARKYHFESSTGKINDLLFRATGFAEQWAQKQVKAGEPKPSHKEIMNVAKDFATDFAKDNKVKIRSTAWLEDQLEAWLGMEKNGGKATKAKAAAEASGH